MKNLLLTIGLLLLFLPCTRGFSQTNRTPGALGREEYIEVEKNVRLHVTDLGTGQPIVLIQGWPLSDAMYQYQYAFLLKKDIV